MSVSVQMEDEETIAFADGHCDGVTIYIGEDDVTTEQCLLMTPDGARDLARELLNAADKAEAIRGLSGGPS